MDLLERFFRKIVFASCIFSIVFLNSCVTGSMPNMETSECAESKEPVKKFYSVHFDQGLKISEENTDQLQFLTPELSNKIIGAKTETDYFTTSYDDSPRAFRLGSCKVIEPTKTQVEVLLLWKNEEAETKQKVVQAEVVKQDNKWLINNILQ